ncbi:hypothetical protein GCM10028808_57790 [Spirosoma migulaei]
MPSKTTEELLAKLSPEGRAAIQKMTPEQLGKTATTGQQLQERGVSEKPEYQESARRAEQTRTSEPPEQLPQRGAQLIQQKREEAQKESQTPKVAEQSKDHPGQTASKDQDKDR